MPAIKGNKVTIAARPTPVQDRLARATGRVSTLTGKLRRLTDGRRPDSPELQTAIEQTKKAIEYWEALAKAAQYEIDQTGGSK